MTPNEQVQFYRGQRSRGEVETTGGDGLTWLPVRGYMMRLFTHMP